MTHGCLKARVASYSSKYRASLRYLNKLKKERYSCVRLDILWGLFFSSNSFSSERKTNEIKFLSPFMF